jgi:triosephosphate isomerase
LPLSVLFCAAELTLGLMLVFGIKTRVTSVAAGVVMVAFLVITFLSATVLPVGDCGCFGDAIRLSPWGSFAKNVVLTALAGVVWWDARSRKLPVFPISVREWISTSAFAGVSVGLAIFCLLHLPIIDFLPFKKGTDLRTAIYGEGVESDIALREFAVFSASGDVTEQILNHPGRVYLLVATDLGEITPRVAEHFEKAVKKAANEAEGEVAGEVPDEVSGEISASDGLLPNVVLVTASPIENDEKMLFGATQTPVPVYNMGSGTMITMLRARLGMVLLDNGVIVEKRNWRDI